MYISIEQNYITIHQSTAIYFYIEVAAKRPLIIYVIIEFHEHAFSSHCDPFDDAMAADKIFTNKCDKLHETIRYKDETRHHRSVALVGGQLHNSTGLANIRKAVGRFLISSSLHGSTDVPVVLIPSTTSHLTRHRCDYMCLAVFAKLGDELRASLRFRVNCQEREITYQRVDAKACTRRR